MQMKFYKFCQKPNLNFVATSLSQNCQGGGLGLKEAVDATWFMKITLRVPGTMWTWDRTQHTNMKDKNMRMSRTQRRIS